MIEPLSNEAQEELSNFISKHDGFVRTLAAFADDMHKFAQVQGYRETEVAACVVDQAVEYIADIFEKGRGGR